jgi:antitoxin PrlF
MSGYSQDCKIDSIVTIDLKGQIVLPKNLRARAGFKPNDKLALISFEKEGEVCCVIMLKAEKLEDAVTKTLSIEL